ncbi:hypothetical protein DRJ22_00635 [Candidatus Woesearchaeota archaeon]|nr:MAG: hypothetical protein DRJ22_00635 [Candidatus Woesearchaeota archaeon]
MVVRKRKKITRKRGSRSYGWGARHRGAGKHGGAGHAGSGKRADQKKPSYWKTVVSGKYGFAPKGVVKPVYAVNFVDVENHLGSWLESGVAKKDGDFFVVNLKKLGFTKLLSKGKLSKKFKFIVDSCSKLALDKLKASGCEIIKE